MAFKEKVFHKEENCLNCGYPLVGKYCAQCGQKAFFHKDSAFHMVMHFAGDYFHYDSKFWNTIKALFQKPGLVTHEYINGKRAKYLNPIQLYIFVTSIFFLFFYILTEDPGTDIKIVNEPANVTRDTLTKPVLDSLEPGLHHESDKPYRIGLGKWTPKELTLKEYDSAQHALPIKERNGFFRNLMVRKAFKMNSLQADQWQKEYIEKLIHNIPKIFFILLPFFAFILKIFYWKRKLFYVDHLIFSLHFHSMLFIGFGILFLFNYFITNFILEAIINLAIILGLGFYLFLSLRRVYQGSALKTLLKQTLIFFSYFLGFLFTLILLFIITFFLV